MVSEDVLEIQLSDVLGSGLVCGGEKKGLFGEPIYDNEY